MKIRFFTADVDEFINSLEPAAFAKVLRALDLLEEFEHRLGMPHTKKVAPGIFELRARGDQEVRLFYSFSGGSIVLLYGFIKKSDRIPYKDLAIAKMRQRSLDSI